MLYLDLLTRCFSQAYFAFGGPSTRLEAARGACHCDYLLLKAGTSDLFAMAV